MYDEPPSQWFHLARFASRGDVTKHREIMRLPLLTVLAYCDGMIKESHEQAAAARGDED